MCRSPRLFVVVLVLGVSASVRAADPEPPKDPPPHLLRRLDDPGAPQRAAVLGLAVSPDGKWVASAGANGTIQIYSLDDSREGRTLQGHGDEVRTVAFSPDGKHLASGGKDGTLRLWNMPEGKEQWRVTAHAAGTLTVAFAPDGKTLASGGADEHVCIWAAADGKRVRGFEGHRLPVMGVAFSPDGTTLTSGGLDRTVMVWDIASGQVHHRLRSHQSWVHCVAFAPDGGTIVSGSRDFTVRLWDLWNGKRYLSLSSTGWDADVLALAFLAKGRLIVSGHAAGNLHFWDGVSGKDLGKWVGHRKGLTTLAVNSGGSVLVSGGRDGTIFMWKLEDLPKPAPLPVAPTARDLEKLWATLVGTDEPEVYLAMRRLALAPTDAFLPFLRTHLSPVAVDEGARIAQMILDLDADKYQLREQAQAELLKRGPHSAPLLRKALEKPPSSLEVRRRIERILEKLPLEQLLRLRERESRAVSVLERIGTPEARKLLSEWAKGADGAPLTQDAKTALQRLDRGRRK